MPEFHKCKALLDDIDAMEKSEDLGVPYQAEYVEARIRYSNVDEYTEWVGDVDNKVRGTVLYTITGRQYFIDTPIEEFDKQMNEYLEKDKWFIKIN